MDSGIEVDSGVIFEIDLRERKRLVCVEAEVGAVGVGAGVDMIEFISSSGIFLSETFIVFSIVIGENSFIFLFCSFIGGLFSTFLDSNFRLLLLLIIFLFLDLLFSIGFIFFSKLLIFEFVDEIGTNLKGVIILLETILFFKGIDKFERSTFLKSVSENSELGLFLSLSLLL